MPLISDDPPKPLPRPWSITQLFIYGSRSVWIAPVVGGALQAHDQRGGHLRAKIQSVVGQARFQQHARVKASSVKRVIIAHCRRQ